MNARQVGQCALVTTVDALREPPTQGALSSDLHGGNTEREMVSLDVNFRLLEAKLVGSGQKTLEELHG
ncbi:MAG: hypothetical protein AAFY26_20875 [Cyanobacteria bacterium J06638_22]